MTRVSPETDTAEPNQSFAAPSGAKSLCCSVQVVPERTNTYAEPASRPPAALSKGEPTTAVSPETDTDQPNSASAAGVESPWPNSWASCTKTGSTLTGKRGASEW